MSPTERVDGEVRPAAVPVSLGQPGSINVKGWQVQDEDGTPLTRAYAVKGLPERLLKRLRKRHPHARLVRSE